ncbi:HTH domain-containing protein, partial [Lactiplantibacillus plantarum]
MECQSIQTRSEWQSGDQLAQSVGCSRESIWKAINALRKQGHQIESR